MTWAHRRQFFYLSVFIIILATIAFFIVFPYLNPVPTCMDNKKNGVETGVDCGGSCARSCTAEVEPVSILWARSFKVVTGRYNALAYLENKNTNSAINRIKYTFRFSDKNNVLIGERKGETYVPPASRFAIFEQGMGFGDSVPVYTTFEFTEEPYWVKVPQAKMDQLKLFISDVDLQDERTTPRMSANIKNNSLFLIPDINIVTILYDTDGDAVSASRTYVNSLQGEQSVGINFTWPEPFADTVVAKEMLPMYNIFDVKF